MSNASLPPASGGSAVATEEATRATASGAGQLRRGALGLPQAIVISVAVMSPAASIFFNTVGQVPYAGTAIPLCFAVAFVVALLVANQYSELSRELPSSGSSYTFVSEGIGPRWGLLTGWVGLIAIGIGVPFSFILMSANLQTLAQRWFGLSVSWLVFYVVAVALIFLIAFIGIRQSLRIDLTFLIFEFGTCLTLAGIIFFRLGSQGQLSSAPFTTSGVPPNGALIIGIVLAVLSFIGFETASTLGEETRNPHRNIPRAVYGSMIVIGVFYVVMAYAATEGGLVGIVNASIVNGNPTNYAPFDDIARHFGGDVFAALVDIVGVVGFFSAALAIVNGGARILYAVGRDGLFPRWLSWIHPTRQTPGSAIAVLCGIGLVVGVPLGLAYAPIDAYTLLGTLDAVFILFIYTLTNIACMRFFWRQRRAKFNIIRHGFIPALCTVITSVIFVLAVIPTEPALIAVPIVVGVWLLLGLLLLVAMRKQFAKPAAE